MWIIVLMAIDTICCDRFISPPRMTFGAVHAGVLTHQGKFTHRVMVKLEVLARKTCLLMATIATLRPKLTAVDITVAASTVTSRRLPFAP